MISDLLTMSWKLLYMFHYSKNKSKTNINNKSNSQKRWWNGKIRIEVRVKFYYIYIYIFKSSNFNDPGIYYHGELKRILRYFLIIHVSWWKHYQITQW